MLKTKKFANEIGIRSEVIKFNSAITEQELIKQIHKLNNNNAVHGILVQLPLPNHINSKKLLVKLIQIKMWMGFIHIMLVTFLLEMMH